MDGGYRGNKNAHELITVGDGYMEIDYTIFSSMLGILHNKKICIRLVQGKSHSTKEGLVEGSMEH